MRRRADWAVVAALFAPIVPLAVSVPLLREANRYAGAFWTEFDLGSAPEFFVFLLRADVFSSSRIPTWLGIGFADRRARRGARRAPAPSAGRADRGGCRASASSSFRSSGSSSASSSRVRTSSATCSRPSSGRRSSCRSPSTGIAGGRSSAAVAAAVVLTLWFGVLFQYWHRDVGVDIDRRERLVAFLQEHAPPGGTTVAVAHPHDYLELAHYAPRSLAGRLVRLSDPERSLRYTGSRSTEDGLVVLAGVRPAARRPVRRAAGAVPPAPNRARRCAGLDRPGARRTTAPGRGSSRATRTTDSSSCESSRPVRELRDLSERGNVPRRHVAHAGDAATARSRSLRARSSSRRR